MHDQLTSAENRQYDTIRAKDTALRSYLDLNSPEKDTEGMLRYLTGLKNTLGNLNNDVSFIASLLVKPFLKRRFGVEFDAASKPQGAAGLDISCVLPDGTLIIGEIKTTKPYQPGFGANQKKEIRKDLLRLVNSSAQHRFMFVTDSDAYLTLCGKGFSGYASGIEIVNLASGQSYVCS